MPRVGPSGLLPNWDAIYELAEPQAGYFTVEQAARVGFSRQLIKYHVEAGHLLRVGRGIFRLSRFPTSEREDLVPVWLWSREQGVFSHVTALCIHELSDALPERKDLTLPAAWRARRLRVPGGTNVHYADIPDGDRAWHGPVPVTTPLRTVTDCLGAGVPMDVVEQAVSQGVRRKLFTKAQVVPALRRREGAA